MADARTVMINAAAPPPGADGLPMAAPGQMAMVVGGQTVTGPAAQAYSIMAAQPRMQVRQQRQWIEALTGFERNNRYVMRGTDGQDLFFIKENSSCIERNCCHGQCKAWRMDIFLLGPRGLEGGEGSMVPFMHLERPCTMTCMCLDRPEVEISELPSGRIVGYIIEPFTFCNLFFTLHDHLRNPLLQSDTPICRAGLCCACPCEGIPCNEVQFPVTDINTAQQVAMIHKYWMWGDMCQCLGEWDNYWAEFGAVNNPDYKVLVLALAIFIQMRFFDKRNQQN
mmetsp:Transcript_26256/g.47959  ORF Transcript_26256/g.47959 Transcript_26256/m.47959 type:complete len:281 (-) Transcript_26256:117-959(-)